MKRSSLRRSRCLMVFNFQLVPAAGGQLGTLTNMDSRNPTLYIDFPEGRLRVLGTILFPNNKYIMLRPGSKEMLCEDVLDSLIVFSKHEWVGREEDNPGETALPMPEFLKERIIHTNVNFNAIHSTNIHQEREANNALPLKDIDDGDDLPRADVHATTRRRPSRSNVSKRRRYAEDSDASLVDSSRDGSEDNGDVNEQLVSAIPCNERNSKKYRRQSIVVASQSQPDAGQAINVEDENVIVLMSQETQEGNGDDGTSYKSNANRRVPMVDETDDESEDVYQDSSDEEEDEWEGDDE